MIKRSAASIRQQLLNLARARGENFDYVLKTYLIQRLLYRLGLSSFRDRFLLKGAMLFGSGTVMHIGPLATLICWDLGTVILRPWLLTLEIFAVSWQKMGWNLICPPSGV